MILCTNTNWVIFSSDWFFLSRTFQNFVYTIHCIIDISAEILPVNKKTLQLIFYSEDSLSRSYRVQVLPSKFFALVYQFLIDLRELQKNCITFTLSIKVLNWKFVRKYKWAKEQSNIISQRKPSDNIVKKKFGKLVTCIFSFKI